MVPLATLVRLTRSVNLYVMLRKAGIDLVFGVL